MRISESSVVGEMHGCIVCAKLYNVLVVYTPEGVLLDCTVTSPGGHIVKNKKRPLVACDVHAAEEVMSAFEKHPDNSMVVDHEREES